MHNPTPPLLTAQDIERFWSKVDRTGDGCWLWTAGRDKNGYGKIQARRHLRAHRVALFLITGEWPAMAIHGCDNPPCCRVGDGHLRAGNLRDNIDDMMSKGRQATGLRNGAHTHPEKRLRGANHPMNTMPWLRQCGDNNPSRKYPERVARGDRSGARLHPELLKRGSEHPNAKLTEIEVREIRRKREEGRTLTSLGDEYGVSFSLIHLIVKRRYWRHI